MDQNQGVKGISGVQTKAECWSKCKKMAKVRGCEFHLPTKSCIGHFKDVAGGSGKAGASVYTCLLLLDDTGKTF